MNVWISYHGAQEPREYPIEGINPINRQKVSLGSREELEGLLIACWDDAIEHKFSAGEACFKQLPFFGSTGNIIDRHCQERIKEYQFAKSFGIGGFEITTERFDDFLIIEDECRLINTK